MARDRELSLLQPNQELVGELVRLRALDPDDVDRLTEVLGEKDVRRWWGLYDEERVRAEFFGRDVGMFVIESQGRAVGAIEFVEATDEDYRHAALDLFLSSKLADDVGVDAVRVVARHLLIDCGHHRLVAAPGSRNERVIGFFRAIGFHDVGVLHDYERQPDGTWQDCLLLELLRDDFEG